jgi:DNA-binding CsgD family transcriptional regulator
MKLNKREKELLRMLISVANKLLTVENPTENSRLRRRRSRTDAAKLRKQVKMARQRGQSVKDIARKLGITPSYVYQLMR